MSGLWSFSTAGHEGERKTRVVEEALCPEGILLNEIENEAERIESRGVGIDTDADVAKLFGKLRGMFCDSESDVEVSPNRSNDHIDSDSLLSDDDNQINRIRELIHGENNTIQTTTSDVINDPFKPIRQLMQIPNTSQDTDLPLPEVGSNDVYDPRLYPSLFTAQFAAAEAVKEGPVVNLPAAYDYENIKRKKSSKVSNSVDDKPDWSPPPLQYPSIDRYHEEHNTLLLKCSKPMVKTKKKRAVGNTSRKVSGLPVHIDESNKETSTLLYQSSEGLLSVAVDENYSNSNSTSLLTEIATDYKKHNEDEPQQCPRRRESAARKLPRMSESLEYFVQENDNLNFDNKHPIPEDIIEEGSDSDTDPVQSIVAALRKQIADSLTKSPENPTHSTLTVESEDQIKSNSPNHCSDSIFDQTTPLDDHLIVTKPESFIEELITTPQQVCSDLNSGSMQPTTLTEKVSDVETDEISLSVKPSIHCLADTLSGSHSVSVLSDHFELDYRNVPQREVAIEQFEVSNSFKENSLEISADTKIEISEVTTSIIEEPVLSFSPPLKDHSLEFSTRPTAFELPHSTLQRKISTPLEADLPDSREIHNVIIMNSIEIDKSEQFPEADFRTPGGDSRLPSTEVLSIGDGDDTHLILKSDQKPTSAIDRVLRTLRMRTTSNENDVNSSVTSLDNSNRRRHRAHLNYANNINQSMSSVSSVGTSEQHNCNTPSRSSASSRRNLSKVLSKTRSVKSTSSGSSAVSTIKSSIMTDRSSSSKVKRVVVVDDDSASTLSLSTSEQTTIPSVSTMSISANSFIESSHSRNIQRSEARQRLHDIYRSNEVSKQEAATELSRKVAAAQEDEKKRLRKEKRLQKQLEAKLRLEKKQRRKQLLDHIEIANEFRRKNLLLKFGLRPWLRYRKVHRHEQKLVLIHNNHRIVKTHWIQLRTNIDRWQRVHYIRNIFRCVSWYRFMLSCLKRHFLRRWHGLVASRKLDARLAQKHNCRKVCTAVLRKWTIRYKASVAKKRISDTQKADQLSRIHASRHYKILFRQWKNKTFDQIRNRDRMLVRERLLNSVRHIVQPKVNVPLVYP